eukprot:501450-Alexandrium_andersonii.AAC.1
MDTAQPEPSPTHSAAEVCAASPPQSTSPCARALPLFPTGGPGTPGKRNHDQASSRTKCAAGRIS